MTTTPKPEPAPEPKQGSVDNSVFTASQAAYLSMERERDALRAEVERLQRLILQAGARENGLKADLQLATEELAAAKEEIASLKHSLELATNSAEERRAILAKRKGADHAEK